MVIKKNWVTLHRSKAFDATQWASRHCPTYITNDYSCKTGRRTAGQIGDDFENIDFFFGTTTQGEKDMTFFILKWS
jgi:hypothetical protein